METHHIMIIAVLGIGGLAIGMMMGSLFGPGYGRKGPPPLPAPPQPTPSPPSFWRRVLVKDLKVGEVYRDRLSGNRVKVVRTRLFDPEKQRHLRDMADCTMWNAARGCYQDVHLCDGDLETDNPMLDASEERRIARMARLGP